MQVIGTVVGWGPNSRTILIARFESSIGSTPLGPIYHIYRALVLSFARGDLLGAVASGRELGLLHLVWGLRLIDPLDGRPKPLTMALRVV